MEQQTTGSRQDESDVLYPDLKDNVGRVQLELLNCSDIMYRNCSIDGITRATLIYVEGMCDIKAVDEFVLQPLIEHFRRSSEVNKGRDVELKEIFIPSLQVSIVYGMKAALKAILRGETAIFTEGNAFVMLANLIKMEQRSIEEATSEKVVRGPRDAFMESLQTNTSLLRRRIHSSKLKLERMTIGSITDTEIVIGYMEGIVKESLLKEVRERLQKIQIDGVIHSSNIEEYIEDDSFSPFPQIQNTERPDVAVSSLLEGKVIIITDNTPFVLIVPMTYWSGLQAVDDYTDRFMYATFVRWIRYTFVHVSLLLPSLYVALTTYHLQVIPTPLVVSIASAREGVPLPAVIEALIMEFIFEGLREAGIRLPQQVGPAVSIAGALVIGQAVVAAGIISTPMVIIVSLTGIASFAFPLYNLGTAYRMLRFPLLIAAGILGFYGIVLFLIALSVHMVMLKPFGVPYMAPYAPLSTDNLSDVFVRAPKPKMRMLMPWLAQGKRERFPKRRK
ncbi:spore germination protein [Paenibacillus sp. MMS20-IR301]|uniref:spore germination protein n=1 Tax=Paenibacillus sp. MMS20-IR301 TaxID=2895946 RepID=UPI0028E4E68C|nr:spore germination protein [Paenibacillus sp. MMS20-IR301]WNS46000.1 spore germination protein [Paenibacillus sp. MMS20-IR301]